MPKIARMCIPNHFLKFLVDQSLTLNPTCLNVPFSHANAQNMAQLLKYFKASELEKKLIRNQNWDENLKLWSLLSCEIMDPRYELCSWQGQSIYTCSLFMFAKGSGWFWIFSSDDHVFAFKSSELTTAKNTKGHH